ncbi:hypothetical protein TEH_19380 [Tetragenococcus halophilus NBRC 12172]|uniref:Uncharacterized protein n=1 Tax=Tetragenococcus halophilus (strain DSM 20338 / JCM 20259 / NCIMB 9735 / NBRC 12172) TaxID=945021 RepID=A0AAN1SHS7_TETHN|nr:hypothetical protein TEH_19380 [Tetragenococcus halophilus NBRC 12172]
MLFLYQKTFIYQGMNCIFELSSFSIVSYDNATETFELTEAQTNQAYQFDNIDIVAMEIYDLIQ